MRPSISTATSALLGLCILTSSTCASADNGFQKYWATEVKNLDKQVDIVNIRIERANNGPAYKACSNLAHAALQATHVARLANLALDPGLKSQQPTEARKYFSDTYHWSTKMNIALSTHIARNC